MCGDVPDDGSLEFRAGLKIGHPLFQEMQQPRDVITKGGARMALEVNLRSLCGQWFVRVRANLGRDRETVWMWFKMQEISYRRSRRKELRSRATSWCQWRLFSRSWIRRAVVVGVAMGPSCMEMVECCVCGHCTFLMSVTQCESLFLCILIFTGSCSATFFSNLHPLPLRRFRRLFCRKFTLTSEVQLLRYLVADKPKCLWC